MIALDIPARAVLEMDGILPRAGDVVAGEVPVRHRVLLVVHVNPGNPPTVPGTSVLSLVPHTTVLLASSGTVSTRLGPKKPFQQYAPVVALCLRFPDAGSPLRNKLFEGRSANPVPCSTRPTARS